MTNEQAKDVLLNYTCCCKYGVSPVNCSDEECDFGKAVKTLCERPQGKWELIANDTVNLEYIYKCSECGREVRVYNASALTDIYPFCHCGADMRGDKE